MKTVDFRVRSPGRVWNPETCLHEDDLDSLSIYVTYRDVETGQIENKNYRVSSPDPQNEATLNEVKKLLAKALRHEL